MCKSLSIDLRRAEGEAVERKQSIERTERRRYGRNLRHAKRSLEPSGPHKEPIHHRSPCTDTNDPLREAIPDKKKKRVCAREYNWDITRKPNF